MDTFLDLKQKKHLIVWKKKEKPTPQKLKEQLSTRKVMTMIFWGQIGVVLVKYAKKVSAVSSNSFFETLICLHALIKHK